MPHRELILTKIGGYLRAYVFYFKNVDYLFEVTGTLGIPMKKLILIAAFFSGTANAAMLTTEVIQDMKKICIYSDGSTVTISAIGICPLSK